MMVVDASPILAILFEEADAGIFETVLADTPDAVISPINLWEVMVRARSVHGQQGVHAAETLLAGLGLRVATITADHARLAIEASQRFGRGTPAALNMGDCFAYALAKAEACALLFKGGDFTHTDVEPAAR
jgi:ribonuclease VapC